MGESPRHRPEHDHEAFLVQSHRKTFTTPQPFMITCYVAKIAGLTRLVGNT